MNKTIIAKLDIRVGYTSKWQNELSDSNAQRVKALKKSARSELGRHYGWINGPAWDMDEANSAHATLTQHYADSGFVRMDFIRSIVNTLLRSKAPVGAKTTSAGAPLSGQFSECMPNPNPPPYSWIDSATFPLLSDGKPATVTAEHEDGNHVVPLSVKVSWETEHAD